MNTTAREIVALAQQLGFTHDGYDSNGHIVLKLADGRRTSIPSTPRNGVRSRENTIANLERISGRKLKRVKRRKSHRAMKPSGFSIPAAKRECESWHEAHDAAVDELRRERDELIERARRAAQRRHTLRDIPPLLTRIAEIESRLRDELHLPVNPFDPYTLNGATK